MAPHSRTISASSWAESAAARPLATSPAAVLNRVFKQNQTFSFRLGLGLSGKYTFLTLLSNDSDGRQQILRFSCFCGYEAMHRPHHQRPFCLL